MEFLEGTDLESYLVKNWPLKKEEATELCLQLLKTIKYLQSKNVVHLDLKPQNIIVTNGENKTLKLVDFGCALKMPIAKDTNLNNLGTSNYTHPLVFKGNISHNADLWSFGCILFWFLKGRSLFNNKTDYLNIQSALQLVNGKTFVFDSGLDGVLFRSDGKVDIDELMFVVEGRINGAFRDNLNYSCQMSKLEVPFALH